MSKTPETKKPNFVLIGLIVIAVAIGAYFVYTIINDNKKPEFKLNTENLNKQKETTEPQFKKQGELEFFSRKDGKQIKKIDIEIADSERKRAQGLMYRKTMDESAGMLFVFTISEPQSFWMKNTIMSLDIMFVNENKEIVKIHKSTTPFSEKSLPSEKKSMYVVEVVAGFSDKYGVSEGDKIDFQVTNY